MNDEWCRQVRTAAENFRTLMHVGNGSHVEKVGRETTTVYHPPSGQLLEAEALIKRALKLALSHK